MHASRSPPFVVGADMGNHGAMRMAGRRAAIGATSVALLLAATGSSLAAVRASRYEGGVAPSGVALPAPDLDRSGAGTGTVPPPTAQDPQPGPEGTAPPGTSATSPPSAPPSSGGGAPGVAPEAAGAVETAQGPSTGTQRTVTTTPSGSRSVTVPTLGPAGAPTPTTGPSRPSSLACPSDEGTGALPVRSGQLQAVNFTLPWPGTDAVTLLPLASASRAPNAPVRIVGSSANGIGDNGSTLTLTSNAPVDYTLQAGSEAARGRIQFTDVKFTETIEVQGCRDRSFVIYDVRRRLENGHPLRIVGVAGGSPPITVDGDGGIAHLAAGPGTHRVTLLTANDTGAGGPLVTVSITIV